MREMKITKDKLVQLGFKECAIQGEGGFNTPTLVDYVLEINGRPIIVKHSEQSGSIVFCKKEKGELRFMRCETFREVEELIKEHTGVMFSFKQEDAKRGILPDILILILEEELKNAPEMFERKGHGKMYVTDVLTFEEFGLYHVRYSTIYPWPVFAGGGHVNEYKIENGKVVFVRQVSSHIS